LFPSHPDNCMLRWWLKQGSNHYFKEATQQETDQRIPFEAFTNEMVAEQERKAYEKASKEKIAIHVAIL